MPWFVVAAVVFALSSWGVNASDRAVAEDSAVEVVAPVAIADAAVTVIVSPIPMPARVTELLKELNSAPEMRPAKKLKVAKKKSLPKAMFSRTEQRQIALAAVKRTSAEPSLQDVFNDEGGDSAADNLDFQRSFSRPRLSKVTDQDEEDTDSDITETVKLRLFLARMKAIQAHQKNFS